MISRYSFVIGARQTSGLFLIPITQSTGVCVVAMSFALAIGQFVFGAAQPVFGAIADKYGAEKVIVAGAILALGCVLTPFATSSVGLLLTWVCCRRRVLPREVSRS